MRSSSDIQRVIMTRGLSGRVLPDCSSIKTTEEFYKYCSTVTTIQVVNTFTGVWYVSWAMVCVSLLLLAHCTWHFGEHKGKTFHTVCLGASSVSQAHLFVRSFSAVIGTACHHKDIQFKRNLITINVFYSCVTYRQSELARGTNVIRPIT